MNDAESLFLKELDKKSSQSKLKQSVLSEYQQQVNDLKNGKFLSAIETGIPSLKKHFNYFHGMLLGVSGFQQSGKSQFLRFLSSNWVGMANGKVTLFVPEDTTAFVFDELLHIYKMSSNSIEKNVVILEISDDNGMPTREDILNECTDLSKKGHNYFVVDPMNWITDNTQLSIGYEQLRLTLTDFKQFAKRTNSVFTYVEHPNTPRPNKDGQYPKCNIYMVTGGLTHAKKCDGFLIVHRHKEETDIGTDRMTKSDRVFLEVAKLKMQRYLGTPDTIELFYENGVYSDSNPF